MNSLHVYLSPHLDDAILSCGGLIHNQCKAGESVVVISFCAGSPDYNELSPFAHRYHTNWGKLSDLVAIRRAEDDKALNQLGVKHYDLTTQDSIYRRINGEIIYPDLSTLFGEPDLREASTLLLIWKKEFENLGFDPSKVIIYAPLAAGNHVDHQLVRNFAFQLSQNIWNVWYYEDYPHVEAPGALQKALAWFDSRFWNKKIELIDVNVKINAIYNYKTQIKFIFGNDSFLEERVKRYTAEIACEINKIERLRRAAGSVGRRAKFWRLLFGYHAHAERIWMPK